MRLLKQSLRLAHIAWGNLVKRRWLTATATLSIAIVVIVLVGFLGLSLGFEQALENAGEADVAILLGEQANSEMSSNIERSQVALIMDAPGLQRVEGVPLVSPELVVMSGARTITDGARINITLRGLADERGKLLRKGFRLVSGRWFASGSNEIIVGDQLAQTTLGYQLGNNVTIKGREWQIVGVFALRGNLFEGEAWADIRSVQSYYNRHNQISSVRLGMQSEDDLFDIIRFLAKDPRITVDAQSEKEFFARQLEGMNNFIAYIGWPLAIVLAVGAFTGTVNAMLMSVQSRRRELAILRQIGFSRSAIFCSVMAESTICSIIGAIAGTGLSLLLLDGVLTSTLAGDFRSITYALDIDATVAAKAFFFAMIIGIAAGVIPGWRSVRGPLV